MRVWKGRTCFIKNDAVEGGYEWDDDIEDIDSYMDDELDYGIEEKVDLLASLVESSSSVCIELTSFGFSCGPQASTALVAVDWALPVPGKWSVKINIALLKGQRLFMQFDGFDVLTSK